MPLVRVGPARLYAEQRGEGEPLLLITGFGISAAVFEPVLPRYAARWRVVTYDNRGAGRSSVARPSLSMGQLAADAAGLLDALGIASAHVYGLSMGGMVAQELALRFPHRVRALVLGATSPGGPHAALPLRELATLAAAVRGPAFVPGPMTATARATQARALAAALFSTSFRQEHPERVAELLPYFARHRGRPAGIGAHWWASLYHDTWSRLPRIDRPTLVMHGGADGLTPLASAQRLAARIPGAELAVLPGAGHAYLLEQPKQSYERLAQFLARHAPVAPGRPPGTVAARAEPLHRGLYAGALRTGRSALEVVTRRP